MGQSGAVEFGPWLRARIAQAGYRSPSAFARDMGADPSLVLRWVKGEVTPTPDGLIKAGTKLGVSSTEMLERAFGDTSAPLPRPLHVLAVRLDRALSDPYLDEQERAGLEYMFDQMLLVAESKVRRARRDAGPPNG